jgi:hypothetical protein
MRQPRLTSVIPLAVAWAIIGSLVPGLPARAQQPSPLVLAPYRLVPITLPPVVKDAGFEAFRMQLADIAKKKDRAALARLVAASFFWIPEDTDAVDKSKSAIDNLAHAIGLDRQGAPGWDTLASFALERTGRPDPQRPGVICAPAEPDFDENAASDLANATHTEASDWGYPVRDGVEVRAGREPNAAVIGKLGLHLVRVLPDDSPANAVLLSTVKVLTPQGKIGFVAFNSILSLLSEQMCYLKDANGWKIAGYIGGDASQ